MGFSDLLKKPLPSKMKEEVTTESTEEGTFDIFSEGCIDNAFNTITKKLGGVKYTEDYDKSKVNATERAFMKAMLAKSILADKSLQANLKVHELEDAKNAKNEFDELYKDLNKTERAIFDGKRAEIEAYSTGKIAQAIKQHLAKESANDIDLDDETVEDNVNENGEMNDVATEMDSEIKKLDMTTEDSDEDEDHDEPDVDLDDSDDLDDIDLSSLSDDELAELEEDLRDSDMDDVTDDVDPVELSADEEREADDLMSLAGTTELLRSELNVEERAAFLESTTETQIAVFEGFLLESDVIPVQESTEESSDEDVMTEAHFSAKTKVRFSAEDRKAQLYAVAINVSARAHNDPDFIKLQRVQKMRRVLKRRLQKKYHAEAIKRMKVYFNRLKSSRSSVLAAIGKKIDK